jgi:hypothetical protein
LGILATSYSYTGFYKTAFQLTLIIIIDQLKL